MSVGFYKIDQRLVGIVTLLVDLVQVLDHSRCCFALWRALIISLSRFQTASVSREQVLLLVLLGKSYQS